MHEVACVDESPGAIFFDFQAAFPSLSHAFLHSTLRELGLPSTVCRFVESLYWCHGCDLSFGGGLQCGFSIRAGIRQGCPLSPLLFAVVVDPLLRRLRRESPSATVRAYADDLATVLSNLSGALPTLSVIFSDFALASGLQLNFNKVVIVPLGDSCPLDVHRHLQDSVPSWGQVQVRHWAEYLGFVLGPDKADRSWAKALRKAEARARMWAPLALGLHFACVVFRTYVASILGFLLQLEPLPASWPPVEARILRALVPGPYRWCSADDLHGLRQDFGFPQKFTDLRQVSLAA